MNETIGYFFLGMAFMCLALVVLGWLSDTRFFNRLIRKLFKED